VAIISPFRSKCRECVVGGGVIRCRLAAHQQWGRIQCGTDVCHLVRLADTQDLGLFCLIRKTGQPENVIADKPLANES
jgi:hypothetical protein